MSAFYTTERIGPHRHKTPDGFLLCYDVPIARTGSQIYNADELDLKGDHSGRVMIYRDPEEVFKPEAIASANGKPLTMGHPPDGILLDPTTWKKYAVGEMHNTRQGDGNYSGLVLADILVKDADAIKAIESADATEVSCGYDCDYEQDEPGFGRQHNIVINHLALLIDEQGRCGPRCAIQDHLPPSLRGSLSSAKGRQSMAIRTRGQRFFDRVMKAIKDEDEEGLEKLREEAGEHDPLKEEPEEKGEHDTDDHIHVHVHGHGRDQDTAEERERELGGMDRHCSDDRRRDDTDDRRRDDTDDRRRDTDDEDGGEQPEWATRMCERMEEIENTLSELADAEAEEVDLQREEEEEPDTDVADRRRVLHDKRARLRDRMRGWKTKDEDTTVVSTPKDAGSDGTKPAGTGPGDDKVEGAIPAKLGTGDRRRTRDVATVRDSASLSETFKQVVAKAEILAPGIRLPTFDAAVSAQQTESRMCALRRRTLDAAYRSEEGQEVIDEVLGGRNMRLTDAPCSDITTVFNAASAAMAAKNRHAAGGNGRATLDADGSGGDPAEMSTRIAKFNEANKKRFDPWAKQ